MNRVSLAHQLAHEGIFSPFCRRFVGLKNQLHLAFQSRLRNRKRPA